MSELRTHDRTESQRDLELRAIVETWGFHALLLRAAPELFLRQAVGELVDRLRAAGIEVVGVTFRADTARVATLRTPPRPDEAECLLAVSWNRELHTIDISGVMAGLSFGEPRPLSEIEHLRLDLESARLAIVCLLDHPTEADKARARKLLEELEPLGGEP
jgi:hypothetical protein